ncbi:magnesium transporter [Zobellella iuensis]|uniref:Magnesium transporter MgtE n=1 Tax=Zobellella iuensis TaxID=2803811 RepID=A0ABS1QWP2_9GAMM|nr:magnesium transporter [Zobellella iuensis]MBL1379176.1 magnesium transporter [Zobellella iuensis]
MTYAILSEALRAAMARNDDNAITHLIAELQPADLADFITQQNPAASLELLRHLPLPERAEAFGYLEQEQQLNLARLMPERELAGLMTPMPADERADLFNLLPEPRQEATLRHLAREEREDVRRLASYREGTAGALMTTDYVTIPEQAKVAEALALVRRTAPDAETIYQLYVLDERRRLVGTLSLRELILNSPASSVRALMTTELVQAEVDLPQEEVARLISRYDLLALPVVDAEQRLVGIITYDDAMDVAEEEATEDIHKGGTIGKLEGGLRNASLFTLYRKRIVWLVLLVFANIFSGAGIAHFEETIEAYIVLVFFLPLLIDSGGNAGSQAATLMVRGIATGDVRLADWGKLLGREMIVATGLGLTMALAVSLLGTFRGGPDIALVVALSMLVIVMVGSLIGMSLPFVLNRLGWDPATASAPLVTTIADASGVLIYFGIATSLLGLPA